MKYLDSFNIYKHLGSTIPLHVVLAIYGIILINQSKI
jgi:hypothetical protein